MKQFVILCLVVACIVGEGSAGIVRRQAPPAPRGIAFPNVNIENYLKNERAVRFQLKCLLDGGPCDKIGKYMKSAIPELLEDQCAGCEKEHKERVAKLVSHLQKEFPGDWERAIRQYNNGGLVKPEIAEKFESVLGVKLDPKFIAGPEGKAIETDEIATSTSAPSSSSDDSAVVGQEVA